MRKQQVKLSQTVDNNTYKFVFPNKAATTKKLVSKKVSKEITFTYAIFLTPKGKGYGCFALKPQKSGTFKVAASFCAPDDRSNFSKFKARTIAEARLLSSTHSTLIKTTNEEHKKDELVKIITLYMEDNASIPRWAEEACEAGTWFHTLSTDSLTVKVMVDNMLKSIYSFSDEEVSAIRNLVNLK